MPIPRDPDGVPNLDAMEPDELVRFYFQFQDGMAWRELFNEGEVDPAFAQETARLLCSYAWTLLQAKRERLAGRIPSAQRLEHQAQRLYNQLPDWARW